MKTKGLFIIIDGIAGSGKTTVIRSIHEYLCSQEKTCFRLQDWKEDHPPTFEEINNFDVYFTYEPTRSWVGRAIRYELSRTDLPYGGEELAHAFAIDRQIMYRRLILPAINAGKIVIQDRGVTTSLVYQSIMPNGLSVDEIAKLPGNKLALDHAPNHLILTIIPIEQIIERINDRKDEEKGVFGDIELMRRVDLRFREQWFRELFESYGTKLHTLDTSGTLEESKTNAIQLISSLL